MFSIVNFHRLHDSPFIYHKILRAFNVEEHVHVHDAKYYGIVRISKSITIKYSFIDKYFIFLRLSNHFHKIFIPLSYLNTYFPLSCSHSIAFSHSPYSPLLKQIKEKPLVTVFVHMPFELSPLVLAQCIIFVVTTFWVNILLGSCPVCRCCASRSWSIT